MAAFLTSTPCLRQSQVSSARSLTCARSRVAVRLARSRNALRMCSTGEKESEQVESEENEPSQLTRENVKEPYPGFFSDMKRMGLSEEDAVAQAAKVQNQSNPKRGSKVGGAKSLFKPDGTPYAPWMAGMNPDYNPTVLKKRSDATGKLAADPQSAELSGTGMTWKKVGDNLRLSWSTGSEEDCLGFVVYKRAGKSSEWKKIADYRDSPEELKSKGPNGASYKYLVEDPEPGTWVYRVSDVDTNNNVSDLSQVLVELESNEDTKLRNIALAGLLAFLVIVGFVGLSLDPQS